jgi:hypothetical protein
VQDSTGTYYLTYTAYDGKTARPLRATSTDLFHWKKYGPVFTDSPYRSMWSKSGSIVSNYVDNKIAAVKINSLYWMYWGINTSGLRLQRILFIEHLYNRHQTNILIPFMQKIIYHRYKLPYQHARINLIATL